MKQEPLKQKKNSGLTRVFKSPLIGHYRNAGNRAMLRLLESRTIQAQMTMNELGDEYEQEADHVAGQIMRMEEEQIAPLVQRQVDDPSLAAQTTQIINTGAFAKGNLGMDPVIQFKGTSSELKTGYEFGQDLKRNILLKKNSGNRLEPSTRLEMESFFGQNFEDVRIHSDSQASTISSYLKANAFTIGSNIFFNSGKYDPSSKKGKHLLAHELTHVVQQRRISPSSFSDNTNTPIPQIQFESHFGPYRYYPLWPALYLDQRDATTFIAALATGTTATFLSPYFKAAQVARPVATSILQAILILSVFTLGVMNSYGNGLVIIFPINMMGAPIPLPRNLVN